MTQKLFTRNFMLLILGQLTSLFGNFILKLALSMYVLEVTGSAAIFAGILSIATIPTIFLSPLGGILADRANRRNIMVALDTLTGISVLSTTLLLSAKNDMVMISILLIILSILGAFETPTVQACIPTMLEGENIMKGNAVDPRGIRQMDAGASAWLIARGNHWKALDTLSPKIIPHKYEHFYFKESVECKTFGSFIFCGFVV